jgi:hypothetical protein
MHENREISSAPSPLREGRSAKASGRTACVHVLEKSDCAVVPVNQPNKAALAAAEVGEGRAQMKENIGQPRMLPTQSGNRMSQGLDGVRKAARERKQERFTSLHRAEAVRFLEGFKERLAKFGLELHPEKTRLIEFGRFAAHKRKQWGKGKPETFTFLGFTHYCGRRHKTDTFTVWRITSKQRMVAKLKTIKVELLRRKHDRISQVGAWLRKVVTGYYQYHAVPGNIGRLRTFRQRVNRLWRNVLVRRSQRAKKKWESLTPVFNRWIPIPRILHPYPHARFNATHAS